MIEVVVKIVNFLQVYENIQVGKRNLLSMPDRKKMVAWAQLTGYCRSMPGTCYKWSNHIKNG